jgi:hypothetical protein
MQVRQNFSMAMCMFRKYTLRCNSLSIFLGPMCPPSADACRSESITSMSAELSEGKTGQKTSPTSLQSTPLRNAYADYVPDCAWCNFCKNQGWVHCYCASKTRARNVFSSNRLMTEFKTVSEMTSADKSSTLLYPHVKEREQREREERDYILGNLDR